MLYIEDMMQKMIRKFDVLDEIVKEVCNDLPSTGQTFDAHIVSVKHLEQQMMQLCTTVNLHQPGTLPGNIIQNTENNGN